MPFDAVKMLVLAFISWHLDSCNSLFKVISDELMTWLQFVQNAAAHLMSDTRRYDHISAVLHQLHWLPVSKRVDFKTATLVYHSLSSMAAAYLAQTVAVV